MAETARDIKTAEACLYDVQPAVFCYSYSLWNIRPPHNSRPG